MHQRKWPFYTLPNTKVKMKDHLHKIIEDPIAIGPIVASEPEASVETIERSSYNLSC